MSIEDKGSSIGSGIGPNIFPLKSYRLAAAQQHGRKLALHPPLILAGVAMYSVREGFKLSRNIAAGFVFSLLLAAPDA